MSFVKLYQTKIEWNTQDSLSRWRWYTTQRTKQKIVWYYESEKKIKECYYDFVVRIFLIEFDSSSKKYALVLFYTKKL